jgi:hypothetical protein
MAALPQNCLTTRLSVGRLPAFGQITFVTSQWANLLQKRNDAKLMLLSPALPIHILRNWRSPGVLWKQP